MASNVYTKLNQARMMMQNCGIRQNGVNDFAKYKYFELFDILPASNKICSEINASIYTQFDRDMARLFFVDNETMEQIVFTLPMSSASLKGCHEVQNLGAVQTYLKRYLYQNCYELSEGDILDKTMNPNEQKSSYASVKMATELPKAEAGEKTKAEAELVYKKFVGLAGEGFINQLSLTKMQASYEKLVSEQDFRQYIANCNKNIEAAEKKKAEGFKDDDIPF